jgi:serine protease Do
VVDGADKITVKLSDGREFSGEVRGLDPKLDLALIKIEAGEDLPVASLGESDGIRVGEWVMAIGNPFGLEQTVTVGIVSAKGRTIGAGPYDDFIQTDASINPGNSGGPLFNMKGEVVGINTAIIAGGQGIGFAIPVNMAKQIIPQLRDDGHVTRGWLGVTVQAMNKELADSFGLENTHGALVNEVVKDSPAADAGLKRGDVILAFDGQMIKELNDLPQLVAVTTVDKTVKVEIFRDDKKQEVKVKIGKLDEGNGGFVAEEKQEEDALGITAADVTPELAARYSLESKKGVLVTRIDPDGPAAEANLRVGDLILEADGQEVGSVKSFKTILDDFQEGKVLRLLIQRKATLLYTTVKLN